MRMPPCLALRYQLLTNCDVVDNTTQGSGVVCLDVLPSCAGAPYTREMYTTYSTSCYTSSNITKVCKDLLDELSQTSSDVVSTNAKLARICAYLTFEVKHATEE